MFSGSIVALVTPFTPSMEVDFDAYGRLVDFHLSESTDGLLPCGCTGEAATLTHEEQKQCIKFVVERVAGRVPVISVAEVTSTFSSSVSPTQALAPFAKLVPVMLTVVSEPE